MNTLTAYCLEWHVTNSDAFRDMLVDPLQQYAKVALTGWDGEHTAKQPTATDPLLFCMLPPSPEMLRQKDLKMVWLPMWDQAQGYTQEWWNTLPKQLRIVAFSDVIYEKATKAGLPTLRITYYKNPDDFEPVHWDDGQIVFYWNRTGMIGPDFVTKLCHAIQAKELLFLGKNDPGIEDNKYYELPDHIGETKVTRIGSSDRDTFLAATARANIMIAPRLTEGVGMTFLEAMARGAAVLAYNAPTMSEYIQNGKNGLLFDNDYHSPKRKLKYALKRQELPINAHAAAPFLLSDYQPWDKVAKADLHKLGDTARAQHIAGYAEWLKRIPEYADFVLNW